MKKNKFILFFFVLGFLIVLSCKKVEKEMMVTTGEVINISTNSAEAYGNIIDMGDGAIQHGHCYAKMPDVSVNNSKTQLNAPAATGNFTSQLTNLDAGTKYYIKAYLSNENETVYGKEINFVTDNASIPTITTVTMTSVFSTTASSGGNITNDGGAPVTNKGVCWDETSNPTTADSKTNDGSGSASFASNLTGLTPYTKYYVRAYATNNAGTGYGNEISFTTYGSCNGFQVTHTAGDVAPVTKTVTYGTVVTDLTGESKCWITQNLGADNQAGSVTHSTETVSGWYWQFNRKQGYKHDGTTRTPGTTWITSINEPSDWVAANDPCSILLGTNWRIPTYSEWNNANNNGGWNNFNDTYASVLKLHAAGRLNSSDGSLLVIGSSGFYWSSMQFASVNNFSWFFYLGISSSEISNISKEMGLSVRCIRD